MLERDKTSSYIYKVGRELRLRVLSTFLLPLSVTRRIKVQIMQSPYQVLGVLAMTAKAKRELQRTTVASTVATRKAMIVTHVQVHSNATFAGSPYLCTPAETGFMLLQKTTTSECRQNLTTI